MFGAIFYGGGPVKVPEECAKASPVSLVVPPHDAASVGILAGTGVGKGMGILANSAEDGVDLLLMHYADSVLLLGLLLLWRGDLLLMHYADSVLLLGLLLLWRGDLLLMHYADSVLLLGLLLL